ncbi:YVTN family beta-propeller protein [Rhodovulum imhoffii]|uniref:YVTN family beta-propeller protein n=1 Tax=Rhodovulum imhoffii TaxID=365340 RepID=A0A2T5BWQ4_9RHOB|nr:beta-propeller fold lactonase family protein [Rhodovulum imhoffii]MBK5933308.1 hypothetical protein [Rhodovulum imhoffii]PTN04066.1 YVTN family beta-propeller protein [Rhodovulum imhoffii]
MRWLTVSALRALRLAAVCLGTAGATHAETAYITCQSSQEVGVTDLDTGESGALWPIPGQPAGVAIGQRDDIYIVAPGAKAVHRLARATGKALAHTTLEGGPTGIALDAKRGRLFVSDWFNARLWVLEAATLATLAELATGKSPAGIALSEDGLFLASADKGADQVSLFDARSLVRLGAVPVGSRPYGLRFAPDGRLFVANVGSNDVSVIDPRKRILLATVPVGERPYAIAFAHGRAFVTNQYHNTVSVIALKDLSAVGRIDVGDYPEGIDTTGDGKFIVLVNWFGNTLMTIDADTLDVRETFDTCDGPRAFGTFLAPGDVK